MSGKCSEMSVLNYVILALYRKNVKLLLLLLMMILIKLIRLLMPMLLLLLLIRVIAQGE